MVLGPSPVRLGVTPWTAARQASLSIAITSISVHAELGQESQASSCVEEFNSSCLSSCSRGDRPPVDLYVELAGFSNESTLRMRWPKYWSFSFSTDTAVPSTMTTTLTAPAFYEQQVEESIMFLSRGDRDLRFAFQTHPGSQASPRPEQPLGRGSALARLGAELELRRSGSSLGPSQ